jgi:glycolate oxidase FAD binding subunit
MDTERALAAAVRPALASACPALRDGDALDAVGGVTPSFVGLPASTAEASALLRVAASFGLAVVPRGAGHGLGWGLPPTACDLVVDTSAMDQVIEHAAGDLVARVQAGATIGQVASVLAEAGQQLALDAPADATVGGVIATGTAGPRRFRYGSPRDLLIGVTAVRADGVVAHAGGKVVKNVAGYDIGKLLAGSQGTLALITEATFRLHPLPPAVAWVTAEFGPADRGAAAVALQSAAGSALVPSAVELDWPPSSGQASSRAPSGTAGRGAAGGHLVRRGGTSQADVGAAGVGGRLAGGRRRGSRAAAVGPAALPQHRDPGVVLGKRAGRGAGRGGGRGGGRGSAARGHRLGRGGRAVRLP